MIALASTANYFYEQHKNKTLDLALSICDYDLLKQRIKDTEQAANFQKSCMIAQGYRLEVEKLHLLCKGVADQEVYKLTRNNSHIVDFNPKPHYDYAWMKCYKETMSWFWEKN